jgi:hypothetical protein
MIKFKMIQIQKKSPNIKVFMIFKKYFILPSRTKNGKTKKTKNNWMTRKKRKRTEKRKQEKKNKQKETPNGQAMQASLQAECVKPKKKHTRKARNIRDVGRPKEKAPWASTIPTYYKRYIVHALGLNRRQILYIAH